MVETSEQDKIVIKEFVNDVYLTSELYNEEKISRYLSDSDITILNNLSIIKKKYLKYVIETYQASYKRLEGDIEVINYSGLSEGLLKNNRLIYDDFSNVYCVINNNKIIGFFIIEKTINNKVLIKSFARYIPYSGGIKPIIFKEFNSYPDPVLKDE
jgi:hypothetical protein